MRTRELLQRFVPGHMRLKIKSTIGMRNVLKLTSILGIHDFEEVDLVFAADLFAEVAGKGSQAKNNVGFLQKVYVGDYGVRTKPDLASEFLIGNLRADLVRQKAQ